MWRAVHQGGVRAIVSMPPRHGKSQLVSRWASTYALDVDPSVEIMLTAYGASLAEGWSRQIRADIQDPRHDATLDPKNSSVSDWRTTAGGGVVAAGVNGAITGKGADIGIIDDPIKNRSDAESPTYRENVWNWYTSTFSTRLSPNASVIVNLTRWHHDDIAGRLLEQDRQGIGENWEVISLAALAREDVADPLGRKPGEALWPGRYSKDYLEKRRRALHDGRDWWSLYQQDPQVDGAGFFPDPMPSYVARPEKFAAILVSIDTKLKGGPGTDPLSAQVFGLDAKPNGKRLYLLDEVHTTAGFEPACALLEAKLSGWPQPAMIIVEDAAMGDALVRWLRRKNLSNRVVAWSPNRHGSKEARATAAGLLVGDGRLLVPDPTLGVWVTDYLREIKQFPVGAHDDRVDALSQMLIWGFIEDNISSIRLKMSRLDGLKTASRNRG